MLTPHNYAAIILAAGSGSRMGGEIPKQYVQLAKRPLLEYSLRSFINSQLFAQIILVIAGRDEALCRKALPPELYKQVKIVFGAENRQASTWQALLALANSPPEYVFIHDAARPFISGQKLQELQQNLQPNQGVSLALSVSDSIKKTNPEGFIIENLPRDKLYAAQTPQAFPFSAIFHAHQQACASGASGFTDDNALATYYGLPVKLIEGDATNIKITWRQDFKLAKGGIMPDIRIGNGYDVHSFIEHESTNSSEHYIILCAEKIPFHKKLNGHSDSDVALHALTDAILGSYGLGDIGTYFPPHETEWKNAPSSIFVKKALELIQTKGGKISNIDITLIAQAPQISMFRQKMIDNLAKLLELEPCRIGLKATTNEGLGFIGRGEGIAAIATACVVFG